MRPVSDPQHLAVQPHSQPDKNLVLTLNQSACSDLTNVQDKEWIITNGIGGYASFFSAKLQFSNDTGKALEEAQAWLDRFSIHLTEAGLGQVSEIFDGDAPHQARGCIAQAWSVAELLRLAKMVNRRSHVTTFKAKPAQRWIQVDGGMTLYPGFATGG
jgi:hypothetical protein